MSKRIVLMVALIAVLSSACVAVLSVSGQAPPQLVSAPPASFVGKTVVIFSKDDKGAALEEVQVKIAGGRSFIVGKSVDNNMAKTILPGTTQWLPIDEVTRRIASHSEMTDEWGLRSLQRK